MQTENHKIEKPILFISHATTDGEFADTVKQEIDKVFANGIAVYCTSSPGAIPPGQDWLEDIENKLNLAKAIIIIITPISIERPWLWFELGANWMKGKKGGCRIYPLCAPEIDIANLPPPLDRLQTLSLGKAADLKLLFDELIKQFGFGKISSFKASNISKRIPKYKDVKIKDIDITENRLYSGKYSGYSDDELMEVLSTELFQKDEETFREFGTLYRKREELIHNGKLLHYRLIDRKLDLPPGAAKRLLIEVGKRYGLEPYYKGENSLRFRTKRKRGGEPPSRDAGGC